MQFYEFGKERMQYYDLAGKSNFANSIENVSLWFLQKELSFTDLV